MFRKKKQASKVQVQREREVLHQPKGQTQRFKKNQNLWKRLKERILEKGQ